jgi:hypothetical protein
MTGQCPIVIVLVLFEDASGVASQTPRADPLSVKWKLTDTIARVCNCNCKKTADKITARMLKDLQDKSKARVQTKLKTIVTAATQACYENLFESRKKK